MKRKQGFTLVELLAVIVVLAVIALIATPTILGVIDKTKKGALKNSAYGLIEAATLYYAQNGVTDTERFELDQKNGLNYKGKVENGTVLINSKGKIMVCVNDGDNAAYKNYSDTSVVVVSGKTCNVNASETQVLLDGENTIDEYTNQELTELVSSLQNEISDLKIKISELEENKTDVSAMATLEEVVNTKADLSSLTSLSSQHTTDINRIDNSVSNINSGITAINTKIGTNSISSIGDGTITGAISNLYSNLHRYITVTSSSETITVPAGTSTLTPTKPSYEGYSTIYLTALTNTTGDVSINSANSNGVMRIYNNSSEREVTFNIYWLNYRTY